MAHLWMPHPISLLQQRYFSTATMAIDGTHTHTHTYIRTYKRGLTPVQNVHLFTATTQHGTRVKGGEGWERVESVMHTHTHVHTHVHTHMHTHTHAHTHTYAVWHDAHTHTNTHTHTHIRSVSAHTHSINPHIRFYYTIERYYMTIFSSIYV